VGTLKMIVALINVEENMQVANKQQIIYASKKQMERSFFMF
jgi:hypothetical protein